MATTSDNRCTHALDGRCHAWHVLSLAGYAQAQVVWHHQRGEQRIAAAWDAWQRDLLASAHRQPEPACGHHDDLSHYPCARCGQP